MVSQIISKLLTLTLFVFSQQQRVFGRVYEIGVTLTSSTYAESGGLWFINVQGENSNDFASVWLPYQGFTVKDQSYTIEFDTTDMGDCSKVILLTKQDDSIKGDRISCDDKEVTGSFVPDLSSSDPSNSCAYTIADFTANTIQTTKNNDGNGCDYSDFSMSPTSK